MHRAYDARYRISTHSDGPLVDRSIQKLTSVHGAFFPTPEASLCSQHDMEIASSPSLLISYGLLWQTKTVFSVAALLTPDSRTGGPAISVAITNNTPDDRCCDTEAVIPCHLDCCFGQRKRLVLVRVSE